MVFPILPMPTSCKERREEHTLEGRLGPGSLGSWGKEDGKSETPFPELRVAASVLILKMSLKLSLPIRVHVSHPPIYVQAMLKYRKVLTFLKVCEQLSTCKTKMVCENIWFPLSSDQSVCWLASYFPSPISSHKERMGHSCQHGPGIYATPTHQELEGRRGLYSPDLNFSWLPLNKSMLGTCQTN